MYGHYEDWVKYGSDWKQILDRIQPPMVDLASAFSTKVSRERSDAPQLDFQWYTADEIGRAIRVLIQGNPGAWLLLIAVSAWKDDFPKPGYRSWRTAEIAKIDVPPDLDNLSLSHLEHAIREAHGSVSRWDEKNLEEANQDMLPPRDPNLNGKITRNYVP